MTVMCHSHGRNSSTPICRIRMTAKVRNDSEKPATMSIKSEKTQN